MFATVHPNSVQGAITIPPSKSMAHRAIICASLAKESSMISNVDYSDDIKTTIQAMRQLGALIEEDGSKLHITGISDLATATPLQIDCLESGSTLRFLIPIASLTRQPVTFIGRNRLLQRPQDVYAKIFREQQLAFLHTSASLVIEGALQPDDFTVTGSISSQFLSGLLFTLPLLHKDSTITVLSPFESQSYVDLTIQLLAQFGIRIQTTSQDDTVTYHVPGNQQYQSTNYHVEGDYSQLAFFAVLGAIHQPVTCLGMKHDSLQGDKKIIEFLTQCNAFVTEVENGYRIEPAPLNGAALDLADCPDLGPILMILGMFCTTPLTLNNISRLRLKESDRILAMEEGLHILGIRTTSTQNSVTIYPHPHKLAAPAVPICGYKDHRIVMSFAIAAAASVPLTIQDAEAIHKSYPNFFHDLRQLGIEVELYD